MRHKVLSWTLATLLLVMSFSATIPVQAADYYPADTKYWVDCATGFRANDCVESVEFSDPASEKRDANGFLDYSSIVWKKA